MAEDLMFDDREDDVLEIVLASDEEYRGSAGGFGAEEFRVRRKGIVSRFVPGVEAGAVLALGLSFVGLISSALVDQYAQDRAIAVDLAQNTNGQRDLFAVYRNMDHVKSLGTGLFALAAVVVAILVLSRWQEARHTRWSRPVAQAALCVGLLGLVFAVLSITGLVSGLPAVGSPSSTGTLGG